MMQVLKALTDNQFKYGAIAIIVIRDCWAQGQAPTYREYAKLWLAANAAHDRPNAEWAYLTDLNEGRAGRDWKEVRNKKAAAAINILQQLLP